jgi:hypothetical protein
MGSIGGLLGLNGGANGTGFDGPVGANFMQAVNQEMGTYQYDRSVSSLDQQQRMLEALQGVNGIGNQNNALKSQLSLAQQQQNTAGQYQNLANGIGPNPAQAQLAQNTAANVAQTGALMAGQRGASQNVGMIARQAGRQGAETQQQAAGQAATLQAQQQIAGLQGLSQQQQAIGNTNQNAAQIAGQQTANQIGQTGAIVGANQAQYGNIMNAVGAYNNAMAGMQSNINNNNAQLANTTMQGQQGLIGGILNGGGASSMMGAEGGEVATDEDKFESGVDNTASFDTSTPTFGTDAGAMALAGKKDGGGGGGGGMLKMLAFLAEGGETGYPGESSFGHFLSSVQAGNVGNTSTPSFGSDAGAEALKSGSAKQTKNLFGGKNKGKALEGGTPWAGADDAGGFAAIAAKGGEAQKDFRTGGKVNASSPKQKAVRSGDNYANDKIPAILSEHEIVLPRSVTLSDDPVGKAASFVQAVIAKRGRK